MTMTTEQIFERLVRHTRELLPELEHHEFRFSDSLKALGANSVDRMEILMMTLESLELEVPMVELAGKKNLGELAVFFHEKLQSN